ncbi:MAG: tryptophan halogenase [Psychrosphaera sp.]|jgi:tryptophan halogenase|uniref:tryptophan halogenase family protein n=1 Tax=Psychrosphaera sp. F3M07 TaxID=2841560 RepID=UPI001C098365|nr:tryptophan halogenase family protein [Psychrosphaera sp. F3M07]MBU2917238.1 tryptophan 7-halogenase [Psychrosphaera sp. F3M07]
MNDSKSTKNPVKKVVIAGGGTAGWMAAAALTKLLGKNIDVTLVESDAIPTVGVGEATIPTLHIFHQLLGIKEQDFMAATNATFKMGISFENWRDVKKDYIHSFGFLGQDCWAAGFQHFWLKGHQRGIVSEIGDYVPEHLAAREGRFAVLANQALNHAYHLDAGLYAKYLRNIAEQHGITRVEGKIDKVNLSNENGFIESLTLDSEQVVEGDLFLDCTGFRALLIEKALHTGFEDWSHWLPCDSAIAVQTESVGKPVPYTRSIAHESGWQWRIPLQNRTGNGLVFCSKYMTDDEAIAKLRENLVGTLRNEPRVIKFQTGTRRKHWNKNCIAVGLSSGFIEPLESTSIHLFQRAIVRLMQMFPSQGINESDVNEFNAQTKFEHDNIRDFIILHYHLTDREDTAFWRHCKNMEIPDSLQHRMSLFKQSGRVFKKAEELFGETSWVQVMLGQGLMPEQYHPIVDQMDDAELENFLMHIKNNVKKKVASWPDHYDFIQHYCKSTVKA